MYCTGTFRVQARGWVLRRQMCTASKAQRKAVRPHRLRSPQARWGLFFAKPLSAVEGYMHRSRRICFSQSIYRFGMRVGAISWCCGGCCHVVMQSNPTVRWIQGLWNEGSPRTTTLQSSFPYICPVWWRMRMPATGTHSKHAQHRVCTLLC